MELTLSDVLQKVIPVNDVEENDADDITLLDKDWVNFRFMAANKDLDKLDQYNRFFNSSLSKFTDTSLGGNIAINPRVQYTWYADIRHGGRWKRNRVTVKDNDGGYGLGRYYSEAIDDNATTLYMEFGIPRFNSLLDFFTRAIDGKDSYIAKHGRMPSGAYDVTRIAGSILTFTFFPLVSTIIIGLKTVASLATASSGNNFNFYYFERAMHMYWSSVNVILTMFATELGILVPVLDKTQGKAGAMGLPAKFDESVVNDMRRVFGSHETGKLFWGTNYIDAFAIATRQQRIANLMMVAEYEKFRDSGPTDEDLIGYVTDQDHTKPLYARGEGTMNFINSYITFDSYLQNIVNGNGSLWKKVWPVEDENTNQDNKATAPASQSPTTGKPEGNYYSRNIDGSWSDLVRSQSEIDYDSTFISTFDSTLRDGGLYLCLNVDYQGPVSESFSNSIGEIGTKDAIKSVAKGVHDMRFNFAGGNIANELENVKNAAMSVVTGVLEGATFGLSNVIMTVLGGGYVDIPKKWEDSSMSLPSITYKTRLISPYGNPVSQIQNIYLPLACLLAGMLPLSVGKTSYTSPYLCTIFNKGVQDIRLGMMTSLSIERGTSNLGFNSLKRALAIDVSFTVTDFSTLLTAPINQSIFSSAFSVNMDDDMPLNRYIATVASRDIITNKYLLPKVKIYASRKLMNLNQTINPNSWMLKTGEKMNGLFGMFVQDRSLGYTQRNNQ
jgi:hypothetical protein